MPPPPHLVPIGITTMYLPALGVIVGLFLHLEIPTYGLSGCVTIYQVMNGLLWTGSPSEPSQPAEGDPALGLKPQLDITLTSPEIVNTCCCLACD